MKNYIFRTTATMKEYNRCKWWIDSDIVIEKRISAETVADAPEIAAKYTRTTESRRFTFA